MRKSVYIVIVVLFQFSSIALSARPGNDPNAAVRYLMAIGQLPKVTETVLDDLGKLEKFEDFPKISKEGAMFLDDDNFRMGMRMLKLGAACPMCNYTPDDIHSFQDPAPPHRGIGQLARVARAYAWEREKAGDLGEAVEILTAVFMLGQHLEENGILMSTMTGISCRKTAVKALIEFRTRHPETTWKEKLVTFFKRIPHPSANILASLKYERKGVEISMKNAKANPEKFLILGIPVPEAVAPGEASGSLSASTSPEMACKTGQLVLARAVEKLVMDYSCPLPPAIRDALPKALTSLKYLHEPVMCPEGGLISIILRPRGQVIIECARHGRLNASSPDSNKEVADGVEVNTLFYYSVSTQEFDRLVDECLKFFDELLALDLGSPGYKPSVDSIFKRIETSRNPFAISTVPTCRQAGELGRELEDLIEKVQK